MKIGNLVKRIPNPEIPRDDGLGFVTAETICRHRGYPIVFVRFPKTGWGQWFHKSRLEVISESR